MAPKTYGKKTYTRPVTAFAQIVSPQKDTPAVKEEDSWLAQLVEAAQDGGDSTDKISSGLEGLEDRMGGLTMGSKQEEGATKKTMDRPRHADVARKPHTSTENTLEQNMGGLTLEHKKHTVKVQVVIPARKKEPRKVLEDRDVNAATKDEDSKVPNLKEKRIEEDMNNQSAAPPPVTPVRARKSKSKSKSKTKIAPTPMPQLPTPEPTPQPDDIYTAYVSPLLSLSDRKNIVPFEQWSSELQPHFSITKIAEASFSEVYRLSATTTAPCGATQESVLKLIGLKTPPSAPLPCQTLSRAVRDRDAQIAKELDERDEKDAYKSHIPDVLSEVRLLQNLTTIPGFTIFRDLTILQGRPTQLFNAAWTKWNKARPRGKKSYFPDPSKKASYDATQLWAVVEMDDAGTDVEKLMESGGLASVWAVWDVFWGVCASVAKAEEVCGFEHRDLHLGNICVRSRRAGADVMAPEVKDPLRRKMRFTGLETTVIDYTLSRAEITGSASQKKKKDGGDVAFLDLDKDPALFEGDAQDEYQYEIYRYMRGIALYDDPLQQEPKHQQQQQQQQPALEPELEPSPQTPRQSPRKNTHIRFPATPGVDDREIPETPASNTPSTTPQQDTTAADTDLQDVPVWQRFHPRTNLVWTHFLLHKLLAHLKITGAIPRPAARADTDDNESDEAKTRRKEVKLYKVLLRVGELLCPVALGREGSLGGVKELVVLAIEERWLRVGDVQG